VRVHAADTLEAQIVADITRVAAKIAGVTQVRVHVIPITLFQ